MLWTVWVSWIFLGFFLANSFGTLDTALLLLYVLYLLSCTNTRAAAVVSLTHSLLLRRGLGFGFALLLCLDLSKSPEQSIYIFVS